MLEGDLKSQINYSMVKGIAQALDEKAQILIKAEESFEPQEEETFAEVALPEIEAMAWPLRRVVWTLPKSGFGRHVKLQKLPGRNLKMRKEMW